MLDIDWRDVDWKGIQLLENNSDEVAGSGSDPDVNWKGWVRTLLMEGLDPNVVAGRGLEGTLIGRIRSMLLMLIVPIDVVVVDCSDRCFCCCC